MSERKSVLEQPEINRSGVLQIKIALLLVDGETESLYSWHRTAIPLDGDVQTQMDFVNAHLALMEPPLPPVSQQDIDRVKECHDLMRSWFVIP